jgi:hypothetical protein
MLRPLSREGIKIIFDGMQAACYEVNKAMISMDYPYNGSVTDEV